MKYGAGAGRWECGATLAECANEMVVLREFWSNSESGTQIIICPSVARYQAILVLFPREPSQGFGSPHCMNFRSLGQRAFHFVEELRAGCEAIIGIRYEE